MPNFFQLPLYVSEAAEQFSSPGVAAGLAWTPFGGEIMYVEATKMDGEGKLTLTGQLGEVMKESARVALNWLRSHALEVSSIACIILLGWIALSQTVRQASECTSGIDKMAAVSFQIGIKIPHGADLMEKTDVHIHFPAGAIVKDGPSAGVTVLAALTSLFTSRCVRPDTAMTGEITLRGLILPVGGIKEK